MFLSSRLVRTFDPQSWSVACPQCGGCISVLQIPHASTFRNKRVLGALLFTNYRYYYRVSPLFNLENIGDRVVTALSTRDLPGLEFSFLICTGDTDGLNPNDHWTQRCPTSVSSRLCFKDLSLSASEHGHTVCFWLVPKCKEVWKISLFYYFWRLRCYLYNDSHCFPLDFVLTFFFPKDFHVCYLNPIIHFSHWSQNHL